MHICVYVCIYICIYTCRLTHSNRSTIARRKGDAAQHTQIVRTVYKYTRIYLYIHMSSYMYSYKYIHTYIYTYVNIYLYTYIYTCDIYTYMYTREQTGSDAPFYSEKEMLLKQLGQVPNIYLLILNTLIFSNVRCFLSEVN